MFKAKNVKNTFADVIVIVVKIKLEAHSGEIEFKSHCACHSGNDYRFAGNDTDSSANIAFDER